MPSVFRRALTPKCKKILEVIMKKIITLALTCLLLALLLGTTACGAPQNSNPTANVFADNQEEFKTAEQELEIARQEFDAAEKEFAIAKKEFDAVKQKYELEKKKLERAEQLFENGELSSDEFFATLQEFFDGPHREYFEAHDKYLGR